MAKSYLLPCPCGKDITIDIGQAGQAIECNSCGKSINVPAMRKIRELTAVEEDEPDEQLKASWSGTKGVLFATGLGITVIALVVGAAVAVKRHGLTKFAVRPPLEDARQLDAQVEHANVEEIFDFWMKMVEGEGLGYWEPHPYLMAQQQIRTWNMFIIVCGCIALLGIGTIAASVLMKSS